jgi:hypothetical protein
MLCELLSSLGDRRLLTVNKAIIVSGWSISRNQSSQDEKDLLRTPIHHSYKVINHCTLYFQRREEKIKRNPTNQKQEFPMVGMFVFQSEPKEESLQNLP